jgi:hypothetical protein
MDEGVKKLVAEAIPDMERELFGRPFGLEDACGLVAAYMFRRYGVSDYLCGKDVKQVLTGRLDEETSLRRVPGDGDHPAWTPAG